MTMTRLKAGLLAGFGATVVLSALMIAKAQLGMLPQLNVIQMLARMLGLPTPLGWIPHFLIGTVAWGLGFTLLYDKLPGGGPVIRGMMFGVGAWLAMMIFVMPAAGAGLFGLQIGVPAPIVTLILHLIYGAVLGGLFQVLARRSALV